MVSILSNLTTLVSRPPLETSIVLSGRMGAIDGRTLLTDCCLCRVIIDQHISRHDYHWLINASNALSAALAVLWRCTCSDGCPSLSTRDHCSSRLAR